MNNGLKNYTKQIRLTVGNAAETSININKEDANLHISLPLITTIGLNPIETILTFNLQDKDEVIQSLTYVGTYAEDDMENEPWDVEFIK